MLRIVYPICCGINVHKKFVVACIASTNNQGVTTYTNKRFSTYTNGLKQLLQCLSSNSCTHVCIESTGKFWIPVFNIWIADLFKHNLVAGSFMLPLPIRQLRDLMRYRFKLINLRSNEKNRIQNYLIVSNTQFMIKPCNRIDRHFFRTSVEITEL